MISLFILLPLYCLGIQYERGGWWRLFLIVAVPTLILDVILNLLEMSLVFWDVPREATLTQRLSRLKKSPTWRGPVARYVCGVLDAAAPRGCHCK